MSDYDSDALARQILAVQVPAAREILARLEALAADLETGANDSDNHAEERLEWIASRAADLATLTSRLTRYTYTGGRAVRVYMGEVEGVAHYFRTEEAAKGAGAHGIVPAALPMADYRKVTFVA